MHESFFGFTISTGPQNDLGFMPEFLRHLIQTCWGELGIDGGRAQD